MSINSKVTSEQTKSFPKLMIKWSNKTIWLFNSPKEGTLIWDNDERSKIGTHLTSLCMTDFNDFTGVVHLSNNGD